MGNYLILKGRVVSGSGKAALFTSLEWVRNQCLEKIGFSPYPGTLNVEVSAEYLHVIEEIKAVEVLSLIPPDPAFCTAGIYPAFIQGEKTAIVIPAEDVREHGDNVIEVLAGIKLKDALGLDDGDPVTVFVEKPVPLRDS